MREPPVPKSFARFAQLCPTSSPGKPGNVVFRYFSSRQTVFAQLARALFQKPVGQSKKSPLFWALPACPLCPPLRGHLRTRATGPSAPWGAGPGKELEWRRGRMLGSLTGFGRQTCGQCNTRGLHGPWSEFFLLRRDDDTRRWPDLPPSRNPVMRAQPAGGSLAPNRIDSVREC